MSSLSAKESPVNISLYEKGEGTIYNMESLEVVDGGVGSNVEDKKVPSQNEKKNVNYHDAGTDKKGEDEEFSKLVKLFTAEFENVINREDLQKMLAVQQSTLDEMKSTNESFVSFNDQSYENFIKLQKSFSEHQKMLQEMKTDLHFITKSIRTMKSKYPHHQISESMSNIEEEESRQKNEETENSFTREEKQRQEVEENSHTEFNPYEEINEADDMAKKEFDDEEDDDDDVVPKSFD